jgi:hypothetical protein
VFYITNVTVKARLYLGLGVAKFSHCAGILLYVSRLTTGYRVSGASHSLTVLRV